MLFIPNVYANKKLFKKKRYKIMYKGSNCDQKSQLSEILTEPLNPRDQLILIQSNILLYKFTPSAFHQHSSNKV